MAELISVFGALASLVAILGWLKSELKSRDQKISSETGKRIHAERTLDHVRRNQEAVAQEVKFLAEEIGELQHLILYELNEIKAMTYGSRMDRKDNKPDQR